MLKFENVLPLLLAAAGLLFMLLIFIDPSNIWMKLGLISGLLMIFWAYISYEDKQPIDDVIEFLEQQTINKKYQLALHQQPQHISVPLQPVLFIAHLKRLFPCLIKARFPMICPTMPVPSGKMKMVNNTKSWSFNIIMSMKFVSAIKMVMRSKSRNS